MFKVIQEVRSSTSTLRVPWVEAAAMVSFGTLTITPCPSSLHPLDELFVGRVVTDLASTVSRADRRRATVLGLQLFCV